MIRAKIATRCPVCGAESGVANYVCGPKPDPRPRAGSYVVCADCATVNVLTQDMALRRPTPEERERMQLDDNWPAVMALRQNLARRLMVDGMVPPGGAS